jgi:hypothetical protein
MSDSYYWAIQYPDGKKISQLQPDGTEIAFSKEFEQSPFIFSWVPISRDLPVVKVLIDKDKRLIYFRRRIGKLDLSRGTQELTKTIYALGWQRTVNGTNVKSINWIDGNTGSLVNCDEMN